MKKVLLILGLVIGTSIVYGQKSLEFSAGVQSLVGTKDQQLSNGVVAKVENKISDKFSATLSLGANEIINISDNEVCQFPVLLGAKFYLGSKLAASVSGGMSFFNSDGMDSKFTWSPSLTLIGKKIDVDLRLLSTSTEDKARTSVGFGVMYKF